MKRAIITDPIPVHVESDFYTIASNYLIPVDEISPELLEELLSNASVEGELSDDSIPITLTRAATLSNDDTLQAVIVGVSVPGDSITGEKQTQYFQIQNPNELNSGGTTTGPAGVESWPVPAYDDPSYILLYYSGNNPMVTCRLTSPCMDPITATIHISSANYTCGYSVERGSIVISNDDLSGSGSGNSGGSYTTYLVSIYDDYRMVKQVSINSTEAKTFIPMTGYPAGYYYVNISNESGNVVTRQTVQVQ
jgi:hypothetical protein